MPTFRWFYDDIETQAGTSLEQNNYADKQKKINYEWSPTFSQNLMNGYCQGVHMDVIERIYTQPGRLENGR